MGLPQLAQHVPSDCLLGGCSSRVVLIAFQRTARGKPVNFRAVDKSVVKQPSRWRFRGGAFYGGYFRLAPTRFEQKKTPTVCVSVLFYSVVKVLNHQ